MVLQARLKKCSAAVQLLVALGRQQFGERKAHDAQTAHDNNDVHGCFGVYVFCVEAPLALTERFRKRMVKNSERGSEKRKVAGALGRGLSGNNR